MQKSKPNEFRLGTHFKSGKLYVFDKTSVLVARPWPELRAWRLTARRRMWHPVRPEINVGTPAVYSQGTPRCANPPSESVGEDMLPPLLPWSPAKSHGRTTEWWPGRTAEWRPIVSRVRSSSFPCRASPWHGVPRGSAERFGLPTKAPLEMKVSPSVIAAILPIGPSGGHDFAA